MGKANFTDYFKRDAVRQITERGYATNRADSSNALPHLSDTIVVGRATASA